MAESVKTGKNFIFDLIKNNEFILNPNYIY